MTLRTRAGLLGCTLLLLTASVQAHEAHVHGVGQLDVALDGNTLSLHLDSPLANLVGFEHPAQSARDKQAVQAMSADLRAAGRLFVTSPAAACSLTTVSLHAGSIDPLLLGEKAGADTKPSDHATADGHADLDADFTFRCLHPEQLREIDVNLFKRFSGFQRIAVQVVTPKRQSAATLTPDNRKLNLP